MPLVPQPASSTAARPKEASARTTAPFPRGSQTAGRRCGLITVATVSDTFSYAGVAPGHRPGARGQCFCADQDHARQPIALASKRVRGHPSAARR